MFIILIVVICTETLILFDVCLGLLAVVIVLALVTRTKFCDKYNSRIFVQVTTRFKLQDSAMDTIIFDSHKNLIFHEFCCCMYRKFAEDAESI